MKPTLVYIAAIAAFIGCSCGNNTTSKKNAAITLEDSATIVTEKDSQYLKDDVMDLSPTQNNQTSETPTKKVDAVQKQVPVATPVIATVNGFNISFDKIKIVFESITANDAARQNAEKKEGLSYILKSGNIAKSKVHIYGAKNAAIKLRYQSKLSLQSKLGTVFLRNLGLYMSSWKTLSESNVSGLTFSLKDLNNINFSAINNYKIKNATDRELRNRRTNRRVIQNWMQAIRSTRSADDEPCQIDLDNVQLQISGVGTDGKVFRKTIRIQA